MCNFRYDNVALVQFSWNLMITVENKMLCLNSRSWGAYKMKFMTALDTYKLKTEVHTTVINEN